MLWSTDRLLATHMGSLPRGGRLTDLLIADERGEPVDQGELSREVERAVAAAVDGQVASGIDIGCDGEMPRISFSTYVPRRMRGFGGTSDRPLPLDAKAFPKWLDWVRSSGVRRANVYNAPQAIGPVIYDDFAAVESECAVFDRCLAARGRPFAETFMTAASPGIVATTMINAHYDSHEAYVFAIARELKKEYDFIVDAGYVLQIDAPDVAMERAGFFQDDDLATFQAYVEMHVAALNEALADIPADKVRFHACWGNRNSPHAHDVPCPDILPLTYAVKAGALCLPFANPRHQHEIEAFRDHPLPDHMVLIPGVIDTVTNYVEHPLTVAERLERAVAAVGDRERVIAGTDCGFSTLAGDAFVAEDVVWAKLATLSEGARIASERLW